MPKEIEFVCSNPAFEDSTPPHKQEALLNSLSSVPGLHVYRQDFDGQASLAAILKHDAPKHTMQTIKSLAKRHGVGIDMINDVDDQHVDNVVTRDLEGITHYFNT